MGTHNVAFLGLGAMGLPMALNLARKGFIVSGWNRSPGRGAALTEAGGRLAESLHNAVAEASCIVTMLSGPAAVAAVALGPDGFLTAAPKGAVWVECSTIGPEAVRKLAAAAEAAGVQFIDAPVLGSVGPATKGTLHFVAGGSADAVASARPVMLAMGDGITHFGPVGAGAGAKVISNMVTATLVSAVAEGLALGERLGLDREQVAAMLGEGPVASPIVKLKAPIMLNEQFAPAFQLKLMEKDLGLALAEAHRLGAALPTASGAHEAYAGARTAGMGELDFAAVSAFLRLMARGPLGRD
ncbi:MAG: 3-hydroxyisobutyrate dehydrogenase [Firmicutes bacterium]|nr:3-hydroxyisobutyrate dehydrogenase [Bacillota bacterium]